MYRQRRQTPLRRLDNIVMRADTDPDVFMSEVYQLCSELRALGKALVSECLTTIILDALLADKYSTTKIQAIRDSDLSLKLKE